MRPLAAAGSWPLIDVDEVEWLRLSILPREARNKSTHSSHGSLSGGWPTYLPVSQRLLVCSHIWRSVITVTKTDRHTDEAILTEFDNPRLLQLHSTKVIQGKGGPRTLNHAIDYYRTNHRLTLALVVIKHVQRRDLFSLRNSLTNFIPHHQLHP